MYRFTSQTEHDQVVIESAKTYLNSMQQGYMISTNPGSEKNFWVGSDSNYPDIVVWKSYSSGSTSGAVSVIEEIETVESVNDIESEQWREYSELGATFRLIVPQKVVSTTIEILHRKNIRVSELWYYFRDDYNRISFAKAD